MAGLGGAGLRGYGVLVGELAADPHAKIRLVTADVGPLSTRRAGRVALRSQTSRRLVALNTLVCEMSVGSCPGIAGSFTTPGVAGCGTPGTRSP